MYDTNRFLLVKQSEVLLIFSLIEATLSTMLRLHHDHLLQLLTIVLVERLRFHLVIKAIRSPHCRIESYWTNLSLLLNVTLSRD